MCGISENGSPREVLNVVKDFGAIIEQIGDEIKDFSRKKAEIAILFDYDSSLLSEIEDSCGQLYKFDMAWWILYYRNAHAGFYRLLKRNDYDVDYVQSSKIKNIHQYKVLYVPYYQMIKPEVAKELERFVFEGGILIADEGFGLRDLNTWVNPYDIKCSGLFNGRVYERRKDDRVVIYKGKEFLSKGYHCIYHLNDAETLATFPDGEPALQRIKDYNGWTYLLGFSIGYDSFLSNDEFLTDVLNELLAKANVQKRKYSHISNGVEVREVNKDNESYLTFMNSSDSEQVVVIEEELLKSYGNIKVKDNKVIIPALECGIIKVKK